jgi:GxxExxY protein
MRLDLRVNELVIVEVKTVEAFHDAHIAQLLTYLKLTDCRLGLLINFNEALLKHGVRRVVNGNIGTTP